MYDARIAIKSFQHRRQKCDEKAIEAIADGRYADAARYVTEAAGYKCAMEEIEFMAESNYMDEEG